MNIAIDFDGTCVKHRFPYIGEDIGAVPVLKRITKAGHNLILFTMRSDRSELGDTGDPSIKDITGKFLTDAINWFTDNDIPLWGVQINPQQHFWTSSPKVYADLYIDDAALGCPLVYPENGEPAYVDWIKVEKWLENNYII